MEKAQPEPTAPEELIDPFVEQSEQATTRYMVAIDGSQQSGKAFKWLAAQLMKLKDRSKVFVLIIDFTPLVNEDVQMSEIYQTAKKELINSLTEYTKILNKLKIPNEIKLVESAADVREGLVNHVKEDNIDVLVMGNTGKSAIQRVMLGSVSEYCVRYADCAVVVVK